jgi:hypothetical protein
MANRAAMNGGYQTVRGGGRTPRQRSAPENTGMTRRFPELRVVRFPDVEAANTQDWTLFLNDVGGMRNYGKGKARTLASMTITLVRAKEMGLMLDNKHGKKDYSTPERAARLVAKMREGIGGFVRSAHMEAYKNTSDYLGGKLGDMALNALINPVSEDEEFEALLATGESISESRMREARELVDAAQVEPVWFTTADFQVKGIDLFGVDGYGIDLSQNLQLYAERQAVLEYLRVGEGLNTSYADPNWKPHAVFYDLEEHLKRVPLTYGEELPSTIAYDHPIAI